MSSLSSRIVLLNETYTTYQNVSFDAFYRTQFGDCFFETIRCWNDSFPLLKWHIDRIQKTASTLGMKMPDYLSSEKKLMDYFRALIQKNSTQGDARLRILVARKTGVGYLPEGSDVNVLIELHPQRRNPFFNTERLGMYQGEKKGSSPYTYIKPNHAALYSRAALFARQQRMNDMLIVNNEGHIVESTNANIFVYYNGKWHTPSIQSGCVEGVMRTYITKHLLDVEQCVVRIDHLYYAEEIFLTNAIHFISPVVQYNDCTYQRDKTTKIIKALKKKWGES